MLARQSGSGYRRIAAATILTSLGDGMLLSAQPLLALAWGGSASAVALVAVAEALPWLGAPLLFGLVVDRFDRRAVLVAVDVVRAVAMGALAALVLSGWVSMPLLLAVAFLVGAGEAPFDAATQAMVPLLVAEGDLDAANSRLAGLRSTGFQLAGPPLGGLLFAVSPTTPFLLNAASFAGCAAILGSIRGDFRPVRGVGRTSVGRELVDGLRWLLGHRQLRVLAVASGVMNLIVGAAFAVMVLFARDALNVGAGGFGLLLSAVAVGAVAASAVGERVIGHLGRDTALAASIGTAGAAFAAMAVTGAPWLAGVLLAVFGFAGTTWAVGLVTLRQRLVPDELLGRVGLAFSVLGYGAAPLGAMLGGVIAARVGVAVPLLGGGVAALFAALGLVWFDRRRVLGPSLAVAGTSPTFDEERR